MKKDIKLNNVIFPIWIMWLVPPLILFAMVGNFVIDSIVILVAFLVFKVVNSTGLSMWQLYKKSILKVWGFGFLADILGSIFLFVITMILNMVKGTNDMLYSIMFNPFNNIIGFLIVSAAVLLAIVLIYIFNYRIVFKKLIEDSKIRMKVALTIAIITMPWTYFIPVERFFN